MWRVDPSIFTNSRKLRAGERLSNLVRPIAKTLAISLFLTYPLGLVILGLVYGWIVFWSSLAGSFILIGIAISRLGYSRNFEAWNPNFLRQMGTLTIAFLAVAAFYLALFRYKALVVPLVFAIVFSLFILGLTYREIGVAVRRLFSRLIAKARRIRG